MNSDEPSLRESQGFGVWQPMGSAPRDGTWVLGYWKGCPITAYPCVMFWDDEWLSPAWTDFFLNPTHWMPLPPDPSQQVGPTNAFHAECPSCGAKVDVIPNRTFVPETSYGEK